MAEFKVLKTYNDKELNRKLEQGEEVEMAVKRAEYVNKKLAELNHGGPFLERIKK